MNPNDKVTALAWCQPPEELPCLRIRLYRLRDVARQVGNYRLGRVGVFSRSRRETCRSQEAGRLQLRPPSPIDRRPLAGGLSRRHLDRISMVVEALDKTVNPTEA